MTSLANVFNSDSVGSGGPGPTTSTWEDVLTNGNTSGVNSAIISTGQTLKFIDGINISGGNTSNVTGTPAISSVLIGGGVTGSSTECTIIGKSANAGANQGSTLVGNTASCTGGGAVSVGWNSSAALGGTALGWLAQATGNNSVSLGVNSSTGLFANAVAIGSGVVASAASQIQLGDAAFTTNIRGALTMGTGVATNTTLAGILTVGNCAGVPTGAAANGSLIYNSTGSALYARVGGAWNVVQTSAPATPALSSVLAAGNSSGASDIIMSGGQNITYASMVRIGGNATTPRAGVNATGIAIGSNSGNTVNANMANSTCVGNSAFTQSNNGTAIGASSSTDGRGVSVGASSISSLNSIAIGASSSTGSGSQAISIGATAALGSLCDSSIAIGYACTSLNSITDSIVIGRASQTVSIDGIGIGRQTSSSGTRSISMGAAVANHANNSDCTLLGANIANTTTGNINISILGASGRVTAGANSTDCVGLGKGVVIPAGVTNRIYGTTAWSAVTAAGGTGLVCDAATGRIYLTSSSIRYKQNVKPLQDPERVLQLEAVTYNMKKGYCNCPDFKLNENGESVPNDCDGCCESDVGAIAEQLANVGLEDFVNFEPDPDRPGKMRCRSIKYERLTVACIEVLKKQKYRMEFLDDENKALLDKITTQEVTITAMQSKLDWLESKVIMAGL